MKRSSQPRCEYQGCRSRLLRSSLMIAQVVAFICIVAWTSQGAKKAEGKALAAVSPQATSCADSYCAETSRKLIPEHAYVPPKANQVFRDPEFGSRMIRATDERGIDRNLQGFSFISNSSAEI